MGGVGGEGIRAAAADTHAASASHARHPLPAILGIELAGIVEAVGEGVSRFKRGDEVIGMVGGATLDASFNAVHRFGHVVSCLGWGTHALAPLSFRAGTYSGVFTLLPLLTGEGREHHGEILSEATRLAEAGQLRPTLDPHRYTLDNVTEAYVYLKSGAALGRLVVDLA